MQAVELKQRTVASYRQVIYRNSWSYSLIQQELVRRIDNNNTASVVTCQLLMQTSISCKVIMQTVLRYTIYTINTIK